MYHLNIRPFVCDQCPQSLSLSSRFVTRQGLLRHKTNYHRDRSEKWRKKYEEIVIQFLDQRKICFQREFFVPLRDCFPDVCRVYARLDFVIHQPGFVVIVSVDENQHQSYCVSEEISRMMNVVASLITGTSDSIIRMKWIRFNPNAFSLDGKRRSIPLPKRLDHLAEEITTPMGQELTLELVYMYYSVNNQSVWLENEFPDNLRSCISKRIIS